jgi:prepilin-type N-terminal cleavage/methylation domain-containing protein
MISAANNQNKTCEFPDNAGKGRCLHARAVRGFTLIEMIVLIIIIAIVTSIAVPSYSHFLAHTRFNSSVQEVMSLMAFARDSSVQSGRDTIVRFDHSSETFEVAVDTPDPSPDLPTALQDQNAEVQQVIPPRTATLGEDVGVVDFQVFSKGMAQGNSNSQNSQSSANSTLRFHQDGSSDAANFTIAGQEGFRADIEISPLTGRARIRDDDEVNNMSGQRR